VTTRSLTLLIWALIGAGALGLGLLSALAPRWVATPRAAIAALVASPWSRWIVFLGWMWLGWHLFAR
jgi:hypothetical protein